MKKWEVLEFIHVYGGVIDAYTLVEYSSSFRAVAELIKDGMLTVDSSQWMPFYQITAKGIEAVDGNSAGGIRGLIALHC